MLRLIQTCLILFGLSLSEAGYGSSFSYATPEALSDVQAPAYIPPYLKNQITKTGYSGTKTGYSGTKTGYSGTKTGYSGTKTGYSGTKTGYSGTKSGYGAPSRYSESRSWYSNSNEAPSYTDFFNMARQPFQAVCNPECKNSGICVDTNTCECPVNFHGKYCEFEKKPCLSYPPLPMNALRRCTSEQCTISCMEGHKFIDGTTVANMHCVEGQWQPTRADLTTIPDCEPECNPPCLNGGVCLALDTCSCPADYRGPQCQYSTSVCDVRKLAFNGGYKCSGDGERFRCRLACPAGSTFSSPPAPVYTCLYSEGVYLPQPIPHCVFTDVVVITPSSSYNRTFYTVHSETSGSSSLSSSSSHNFSSIKTNYEGGYSYNHVGGEEGVTRVVIQDLTPKGGTCLTWGGVHYKTFDGKVYTFKSPCQHTLVRDPHEHKYMVAIQHGVCQRHSYCPSILTVYLEEKPYSLATGDDGSVIFRSTKHLIPIPASLPGIRVSMPGDYVLVHLDAAGVAVKWDTNNVVQIEGSVLLWNNTEGLCGTLDGNPENDLTTKDGKVVKSVTMMATSWQINKIGDVCETSPVEASACASESAEDVTKAAKFCNDIISMKKFRKCSTVMDVLQFLETCKWDYCACVSSLDPEECACKAISVYARECLRHGVDDMKTWRDVDTCPMKCPEGKLYKACGSDVQASCAFPLMPAKSDNSTCTEGCFCPEGLLFEAGRCVAKEQCPCRLRNKNFPPGASLKKDCNTCTCQAGEWTCTKVPCGARCRAVGDPHYTTFDGLRYDFMGRCTYTMVQADNFTVEVENVACSGTISEAMNLTPVKSEAQPSCTKAVTVNYDGAMIHLRQGGNVIVNGKEISAIPVMVGDVRIRAASSLFLIVQLPNKVDLWWDGNTRVYIDVPAEFHGKTKGLCGTFNLNQKDDFLTPENDIEQSTIAFANKWRTREFCNEQDVKEPEHPCKANMERKEAAEKYCSKLKGNVFEACHWHVDVESYYSSCVYDMCACAGEPARCLCPVLGDYAAACAAAGVPLQWRYHVQDCELSCTGGQEYTVCADSCLRRCTDTPLADSGHCTPSCVEGCACPQGELLDDNGVCVPVGLCPCFHKGLQFNAGYKEVRPGRRERELCTCVGARWDCKPATPEDIQNYPPAEDLRSNCSATHNMEFTTCALTEPLTCKNMHLPATTATATAECRPGCQCKRGFVLDTSSKLCVAPEQCPCHHGGRSYPDGHLMQEECNKCECKSGNWSCTTRKCAGVCSAWGDSHVTTFDGTEYDFEGVCTYLLAKADMDGKDGFSIEIQNVPCGTTGATCAKSATLRVGSGSEEEIVSLTKNAPLPDVTKLKRIKLRTAGAYVFLDVPSLGMSVQWDREMRVYVKVDSMWRGRVKGLCGNYNADMRDDFQTPSGGGLAESSPVLFAESWKLKPTCPKAQPVTDHCAERPTRKEWASSICGALKRHPFSLCHTEVPVGAWVERCERDACACDDGADCACACAALAAYAYQCAHRGVSFKWRQQELCPMQCDEECASYDDCISPCPVETCENTLYYNDLKATCDSDNCVEGCKPKKNCSEGTVYKNSSHTECVPRVECNPVCMTLANGTEVKEGDVVTEDGCHTCRCSKHQLICTGQPCSTEGPSTSPTSPKPHDEPLKCVTGWTPWISRGTPENENDNSIEKEPLPRSNELPIGSPMCKPESMKKVECRTIDTNQTAKETGLNVECSLERGLLCQEKGARCPDFEIRVYCECEENPCVATPSRPSYPHPSECDKFYECSPSGPVLKSCGAGTLYNPQIFVCDWPAAVALVRPECGIATDATTTELSTTHIVTTTESPCPPGQVYKQCAFPCDKLCHHFGATLAKKGKCNMRSECVEGCVDAAIANIKCEYNSFWRDERTCVPRKDCTCLYNGDLVKPGGAVIDGCIKCQCIDNDMHCDATECVSIKVPLHGATHEPFILPQIINTTTPAPTTTPTTPITTRPPTKEPRSLDTTTVAPIIITSTVTPPPICPTGNYVKLLSSFTTKPPFSASSVNGSRYEPSQALLDQLPSAESAGNWKPASNDLNQYIQVTLPYRLPVHGVVIQGNPVEDEYVTSYQVLYGDDGVAFSTVNGQDGKPKVFNGPVDHTNELQQIFSPPFEAKYIRIHPLTWHKAIALRMDLISCDYRTTFQPIPIGTVAPEAMQCDDSMGLGGGLPLDSISVSSNPEGRQFLGLEGGRGWRPLYSTPGEWIMFNFTSPRNLTGISTKGGQGGWVTAYNVEYATDLNAFSPVLDETRNVMLFRGNFDSESVVDHRFFLPLRAQYLKVLPVKWHESAEISVEPVGCFEPYPTTPVPITTTPPTPPPCQLCPGVPAPVTGCGCFGQLYYDGESCAPRPLCPCVESFMTYPVGSTFRGPQCNDCMCKLGGIIDCKPSKNCTCDRQRYGDRGAVPTLLPNCDCECKPCPEKSRLCYTNNECLAEEKWCDQIQDCPDDELNCTKSRTFVEQELWYMPGYAVVTSTVPPTTVLPVTCPVVQCPPGYQVHYTSSQSRTIYSSAYDLPPPRPRNSYTRYIKGGNTKGGYSGAKGGYAKGGYSKGGFSKGGYNVPSTNQAFTLEKPTVAATPAPVTEVCPEFKCVPRIPPFPKPGSTPAPIVCSVVTCPRGYTLKLETLPVGFNKCPQYDCVPPPERPVFCNVTGRTFNTFDGTEYKYDLCFHILARENRAGAWTVLVRKKCRDEGCWNELLIQQDDQLILVKPNMMIEYDNYEYNIEQTSKICFQKNSFDVASLGNGVLIKSRIYNFTVIFTKDGDVKIGVFKNQMGAVDGLCGLFDGSPLNDRSLPSGELAASVDQFGRAWAKPGLAPDACRARVVAAAKQKRVWELCNVLTTEPLSRCGSVLNLDKWRSICLEKVCSCSELVVNGTKRTEEECRCMFLEQLVAECLAADKEADIDDWRIMMDCPAECPAPLVHFDCYRRRCEPACGGGRCAPEDGQCFPGCYCPDGRLRKGDQCVLPADCLDCACTGVGAPAKYVTFEGDELPFLSNCTYLASRERNDTGHHAYEVYTSNGPCDEKPSLVCTKAVHLIYEKNVIHITKDSDKKKLVTSIGNTVMFKYPVKKEWGTISLENGQDITITLPDIHVELTVLQSKLEFTIRVPSYLYGNQTEGMCGVCAGYEDFLLTSNGTATYDFDEFGASWQATPTALDMLQVAAQAQCLPPEQPEPCTPPPPEQNPCYNINNNDRFGQCHALVDPWPYIESCEADVCTNITNAMCDTLERYAAACRRQGVCLEDWRHDLCPYPCEPPFVYRACVDCERTCDNYEELAAKPSKCAKQPSEGCFCPEGKVRVNNTCIEPSKCFPCDVNKEHYAGDQWQENACTMCTCSKVAGENKAHVSCTTETCTTPVCSSTDDMISEPAKPGACCPSYVCVAKPKIVNCTEPKKMDCGFGQVLKQKTTSEGCTEFACECKPLSECEDIPPESDVEMLEPGMQRLVDNTGCCPKAQLICRKDRCPSAPACPQFHDVTVKNISGRCCPEYGCELPKDKCLVRLEWEGTIKGGEKARPFAQVMFKDLDAEWSDGPCRPCRCERAAPTPAARCGVLQCPPAGTDPLFVLAARPVGFACCPAVEKVACRNGDRVYKVGENWTSPENVCVTYRCVRDEGEGTIERVKSEQRCEKKCQLGWRYIEATVESKQCCGACQPYACVVNGQLHPIGEKWTSSDFCSNYTCINLNGTLQVQSSNETCPEVSAAVKTQFVLKEEKVPGQCCKTHEPIACRVGDLIYQVGENWTSPEDVCVSYRCVRDVAGAIERVKSEQRCEKKCQPGWRYVEATVESKQCCGACQPYACVVNGQLHPIGEKWTSSDFCSNYTCVNLNGTLQVQSSNETCPEVATALKKQFVLKEEKVPGQCCKTHIPIACRVGDLVYQVGENWTSPEDVCVSYRCVRDVSGAIERVKSEQRCEKKCQSGWRYVEATVESKQCCGACQPYACVVNGQLHPIGEKWTSSDFCSNYTCVNLNGTLQVQSSNETCPEVSATLKKQFVLKEEKVPGQCCKTHEPIACRVGDLVYQVGENWTSPEDVCVSYRCVRDVAGAIERVKSEQRCEKKCQPGWRYVAATVESKQCCGACQPYACVVNGQLHPIGEKWTSSDFCSNYTCVNLNGTLQVQSSNETCPEVSAALEKQFVLKEGKVPGQCCRTYEPIACRVGDLIYQEGQIWPSGDPCRNVTCARDVLGQLAHVESVESCGKECRRGWAYVPPPRDVCCGRCAQAACVAGDQLKEPGTTWKSADNCTTFSCERAGEEVFVTSSRPLCADVTGCDPEYIVNETCCRVCKPPPAALSTCVPQAIPLADTVGLVRRRIGPHGTCVNKDPVPGLTECRGTCESGSLYDAMNGVHSSKCECCSATRFSPLTVQLDCEDGTAQAHRVAAPGACACKSCGAPSTNIWQTKSGYSGYSGIKSPMRYPRTISPEEEEPYNTNYIQIR